MEARLETEQASQVTGVIARHLACVRYEDLPPEAVRATKEHIQHTLATIMGGSAAPGCPTVVELVRSWGGTKESSVLVYGDRVPAAQAVLANSTMAHALDYCNNDDRIAYKTSVCAVPAALATAQSRGKTSGQQLITAICVGVDLGIRVGLSVTPQYVHGSAPMLGPFAAAAGAGKILGLDEEGMANALGLALGQCRAGGTSTASPSLTKRLGPGLAAQGGVIAAQLAQAGYPSQRDIFHGPRGFFQTFYKRDGDLARLVDGLGQHYEISAVGPKPYPCCRFTHASIDATLSLLREHRLTPDQVERVVVHLSQQDYESVGAGEAKHHPQGMVDAQFSVPWTVATALIRGRVFIDDFLESALSDPEVNRLADRVNPVLMPELGSAPRTVKPAIVEVHTTQGKVLSQRCDFPRGSPENPVTREEMANSFRGCSRFAAISLDQNQVEAALGMLDRLEEVDDVSRLVDCLCPRGGA